MLERKLNSEHSFTNADYGPCGTAGKGAVITGNVLRGRVTQPAWRAAPASVRQQADDAATQNTTWLLSIHCFLSLSVSSTHGTGHSRGSEPRGR